MTTLGIISLVESAIPQLVKIAEGLFHWKQSSGADKKQFVTGTIQGVINQIDQSSTGGQKNTWDKLAPIVSDIIDDTAAVIFPPTAATPDQSKPAA
ncbi:MAG: hypothetical protein M0Z52_03775 [Actinomycetota bacterium]|nr:hypothetical protein [Actinomycetota bacterium]